MIDQAAMTMAWIVWFFLTFTLLAPRPEKQNKDKFFFPKEKDWHKYTHVINDSEIHKYRTQYKDFRIEYPKPNQAIAYTGDTKIAEWRSVLGKINVSE